MNDLTLVFFSIGNPGPITRHSVGHYMLNHLVNNHGAKQLVNAPQSRYAITKSSNGALIFVKSNAFMNESNILFLQLVEKERFNSSAVILVLYDDFERNIGSVKLQAFKKNESHNGIKSIQKVVLKHNNLTVYKLGIGIGPKPCGSSSNSMSLWVATPINANEKGSLDMEVLHLLTVCIEQFVALGGVVGDINKFNSKVKLLSAE